MKFKIKSEISILIAITILGASIRLINLNTDPPSLNWDEVSHGYNAYSILKTGHDEWGEKFPTIFRAFGDYKLPVYIYLSIIPIYLFGLNTISTRLISTLAGTIAIPAIYFLTKNLFPKYTTNYNAKHNLNLAHFSALILSLMPWHFFISRPALEANLALTFIIIGFAFLFKPKPSLSKYLGSALFLGLSLHTYNTARVFVPLLLITWLIIYKKTIKISPSTIISALLFLISSGLVINQILTGTGIARYSKLSILSESAVYQIGQDRTNSHLTPLLSRLIHNRPVFFLSQFTPRYLSYFSPNFFWQSKGANYQFAIPNQNMITIPVTVLFLIGLIYITLKINQPEKKFILSWLLLSPLAAAMTVDQPHALRTCVMIPSITIIAAYGWKRLLSSNYRLNINQTIQSLMIALLIIIFFGNYLSFYFYQYRQKYSNSWQYGYKEAIDYLNENSSNYSHIIFTKKIGEPHIFYAFYTQLDPKEIWPNQNNLRYQQSDWYWTDKINNIYFVNDWDIPKNKIATSIPLESGTSIDTNQALLITSPDNLPLNTHVLEKIYYLDGQTAFVIANFSEK